MNYQTIIVIVIVAAAAAALAVHIVKILRRKGGSCCECGSKCPHRPRPASGLNASPPVCKGR
ncbi:MAG: FeoB-associated Cys-rich membrane protein [Spirochaetaceae bacterium]|jgi:hypothetical protein|nr:FeoB-associated Cys-rich membrane protein [Spirochaetaceae bacterium]